MKTLASLCMIISFSLMFTGCNIEKESLESLTNQYYALMTERVEIIEVHLKNSSGDITTKMDGAMKKVKPIDDKIDVVLNKIGRIDPNYSITGNPKDTAPQMLERRSKP